LATELKTGQPNGAIKHIGKWVLHVQCPWKIDVAEDVLASQSGLQRSDEQADVTIEKIADWCWRRAPSLSNGCLLPKAAAYACRFRESRALCLKAEKYLPGTRARFARRTVLLFAKPVRERYVRMR
jgi:hypothetical protein